jgi:glycogen synthase
MLLAVAALPRQEVNFSVQITFVSGELYPFGGGGIGQFVNAAARVLSPVADVLVLTSSLHEGEYRRLRLEGDERLPPEEVSVEFVPEPRDYDVGGYFSEMHCYSARVYERLRELHGPRGPDVVEFADYLAEGYVTVQAAQTLDPFLARTLVCVRLHTSEEICEVLNACLPGDFPGRVTHAMERYVLAYADRVIWQGGDILGTYRRFYSADALATDVRIRYPFRGASVPAGADRHGELKGPLRMLYFGRLERRKGVHRLMSAATALPDDDWSLTFIGDDTPTAPLGMWMRDLLELSRGEDPRIELLDGMPREGLWPVIESSDVVVLPSLWDCWPYAALEAMHLNRPVLATPTGGFAELVQPGKSGWLTEDTSVNALLRGLRSVLDARTEIEEMIRTDAPRSVGRLLTSETEIREAYSALAHAPRLRSGAPGRIRAGSSLPLVSVVVPYYAAHEFVRDAVASIARQTYPKLEIILVNDGSFSAHDLVVVDLAARYMVAVVSQPNSGLGAARNLGVSQCRGRYILPLDADNVVESEFVARCVDVLETRPDIAYVTAWSRYVDASGQPLAHTGSIGYQPLGNHDEINGSTNVAGDAVAVIRRRIFDLGFRYSDDLASYEDWHFYRALQAAGHFGAVIPARLIRHRVRQHSMMRDIGVNNLPRLEQEIAALLKEDSVRWTS